MTATNKTNNNIDMKAICSNMVYCGVKSVNQDSDNNTVEVNIKTEDDFLKIVKTSWDDNSLIWDNDTVAIDKYGCHICLIGESKVVITGVPVKKFCNTLKKEVNKYNKTIASRDEYMHELVINGLE